MSSTSKNSGTTSSSTRTVAGAGALALVLGGGLAVAVAGSADAHVSSNTSAVVVNRNPSPTPRVTNLRTGAHTGYDRVTIDLTGAAPGYDVRYVTTPTFCGSGATVRVSGSRFLQVTLKPAQAHTSTGANTYVGPGRTSSAYLGMETVKGVRKTCDFEGHVTFVLGLDHKAGFHVSTLADPTRIYLDIAH
jgi:hypothetical protein